jgi:hypothetical protein
MKEKLLELFEALSSEHKDQLLDYAKMLWEMNQSEKDLRQQMGILEQEEEKQRKIIPGSFLGKQDDEVN